MVPDTRTGQQLSETDQFRALFSAARAGSREAVGRLLDGCRHYLLLIANDELAADLRPKAAASDLVQETFLDAHVAFPRFTGSTERELLNWLRQILLNNLADVQRRYQRTEKRRTARERPILGTPSTSRPVEFVQADTTSPSVKAIRNEEAQLLDAALERLPEQYRLVLTLRHREALPFNEIGRRMKRSTDAARMLWWRAFEALTTALDLPDDEQPT